MSNLTINISMTMDELSKFVLERMYEEKGIMCLTNLKPAFDTNGKLTFSYTGYKIDSQ